MFCLRFSILEKMPVTEIPAAFEKVFLTTCWSVVFSAADGQSLAAREHFVRLYWLPLYGFARSRGESPEDADDAVQTFLSGLICRDSLQGVTREGGRFRDFLRVGLLRHLISKHRAENSTLRRPSGGFVYPDGLDPEAQFGIEAKDHRTPEVAYDRLCARALLDAALEQVRKEYERAGRGEIFSHLAAYIVRDPEAGTHAEAATRLGISEGTLRNSMKPFRKRYQSVFRKLVAVTLDDPSQVDQEICHLLAALSA